METQDAETPIEYLSKRFGYHKEMMNNFKPGSERREHHKKMMIRFANAISFLDSFDGDK